MIYLECRLSIINYNISFSNSLGFTKYNCIILLNIFYRIIWVVDLLPILMLLSLNLNLIIIKRISYSSSSIKKTSILIKSQKLLLSQKRSYDNNMLNSLLILSNIINSLEQLEKNNFQLLLKKWLLRNQNIRMDIFSDREIQALVSSSFIQEL